MTRSQGKTKTQDREKIKTRDQPNTKTRNQRKAKTQSYHSDDEEDSLTSNVDSINDPPPASITPSELGSGDEGDIALNSKGKGVEMGDMDGFQRSRSTRITRRTTRGFSHGESPSYNTYIINLEFKVDEKWWNRCIKVGQLFSRRIDFTLENNSRKRENDFRLNGSWTKQDIS